MPVRVCSSVPLQALDPNSPVPAPMVLFMSSGHSPKVHSLSKVAGGSAPLLVSNVVLLLAGGKCCT